MKIAIISAGVSARNLDFDSVDADQTISVNVAATKFPCDYWVFSDAAAFDKWGDHVGMPIFFTRKIVPTHLCAMRYHGLCLDIKLFNFAVMYQDDISPPVDQWNLYSGCAAIGLAWHLGAAEISLYGFDMMGDRDCSGSCSQGRSVKRWIDERIVFDRWLNLLEKSLVKVDWVTDGVQSAR